MYDHSTVTVFLLRLAVRCGRYAPCMDTARFSLPAGIPTVPRSDLPSEHSGCIVWVSTPNGHHSRVDLTMWCCSPLDARIVPCAGVWLLRGCLKSLHGFLQRYPHAMVIVDFRELRTIVTSSEAALHQLKTLMSGLFKQPLTCRAATPLHPHPRPPPSRGG